MIPTSLPQRRPVRDRRSSLIPESAPFTPAAAGLAEWLFCRHGRRASRVGDRWDATAALSSRRAGPAAEAPQLRRRSNSPGMTRPSRLDERLKLAEDKPQERKLMAAMAQLDCGACGYRLPDLRRSHRPRGGKRSHPLHARRQRHLQNAQATRCLRTEKCGAVSAT